MSETQVVVVQYRYCTGTGLVRLLRYTHGMTDTATDGDIVRKVLDHACWPPGTPSPHRALDRLEARVAELEQALRDEIEMSKQSHAELCHLRDNWPLMTDQVTLDGEPVLTEALRSLADDVSPDDARAALGDPA